ncbi:MAG TPA: hypothetical protein VHF25_02930 [Nitriliruptorales bacterium]|nr:hypothetical protein [Nitriliruptorales bacterium]
MPRSLIVANQTLGGQRLLDVVGERVEQGDCRLYVVVPATGADAEPGATAGVAASGLASSLPAGGGEPMGGGPEEARREAFNRLKEATGRFSDLGAVEVDGEVGDPDPLEAIRHAVEDAGPFDEIIVSTLPAGISRWIRMDLASRTRRQFDLPVVHVEAEPSGAAQ